jgi:hypothetical protein
VSETTRVLSASRSHQAFVRSAIGSPPDLTIIEYTQAGTAMRTALVTQTAKSYAAVTGELRAAAVNTALKDSPRCAVTRFLAGCEAFDAESPAIAVRHMMVAHHSQPQLQAAALLVFAGLSRVQHTDQPLLSTLLETWGRIPAAGIRPDAC